MDCRIRFLPSEQSIEVPSGTTLAAAAQSAGLPIATACGESGLCARCGLEIVEGLGSISPEDVTERDAKTRNRIAPEVRLACRVRLRGDLVVRAPYW